MFVKSIDEIEKVEVTGDGIKNVLRQIPIGPGEGWKDHVLRVFTIKPGGHTPKHSHDWEHINYVIAGEGQLEIAGKPQHMEKGKLAVVPPNTEHQFSNPGKDDFIFICIVPEKGNY
jgi:quercetin dioxygenase-like cupin family protein